jgi:Hyaluronidase protein (HylP)
VADGNIRPGDYLTRFHNLADLTDPSIARNNLGVGSFEADISAKLDKNVVGAHAGSAQIGTGDDPAGTAASYLLDVRSISTTDGAGFFKVSPPGGSSNAHALTARNAATSGTGSALNVTSDNDFSSMQVSGHEKSTGTIKVSHIGQPDGSDAGAAALSIDLKTSGTAAQGIFMTGTQGATTGNLLTLRNNARDDLVVKATGRVGVGVATGATPGAAVDIRPSDNSTKGLMVQAPSSSASALMELRNSGGTPTVVASKDGDLYAAANALGIVTPANHGLTAWAYDPALALNSSVLTSGTVYLIKVHVSLGVSVTKLYWHVAVVAVTPTSSQNFVGLYDSTGARLATIDVTADVTATGIKATTIPSTGLTTGAFYWVALVTNAVTPPAISRTTGLAGAGGLVNVGLSVAAYRFATNGTSQTSLPVSITPGSASQGLPLWMAIGP